MLSDMTVRNAEGGPKPYKLADGGGMYLLVRPDSARYWRMDYAFQGKRKTLSLGVYPTVKTAAARKAREAAKEC